MSEIVPDKLAASVSFLENDFNQCFQQVRHYDSQIFNIFKYLATFYTTVAGVAVGLYQFSIEKNVDIRTALLIGLSIALMFGIFMFPLIIRNRVYFVICMRYINEHRGFFLSTKPLGFENKCGMYTDYKQPPFFSIFSSHSGLLYVLSMLNSLLLGVIFYIGNINLIISIFICAFLFFGLLISGIAYLKSRENKSAPKAVFGK